MIIVAGGGKGGSGKSTIATNLTTLLLDSGVLCSCVVREA
jgi:MinD superfamily P-loop ATPase